MGNLHSRIPTRGTSSQPMPVTISGGGPLSVTIPTNSPIPISLASYQTTLPVSLASVPVPVSGTFFQTTQPVSLASILVPISLASIPVPVSGSFFQTTQPVSLASIFVPISLASLPVPVSGSFFQTTQPVSLASVPVPVSGSFFQSVQPVSQASLPLPVSGTFYQTTQPVSLASVPVPVSLASIPVPVTGSFFQTTQPISLASVLVPISLASVPVPVSGTFFQTTQPVSLSSVLVPISLASVPVPVSLSVLPNTASLVDSTANPSLTEIQDFPMTFNGVTWDRIRSFAGASGATLSTGIPGSGIVAWNGTNYEDITTNSSATANKYGLDANILSILGTAPTTAGKLDVKGADGDIFVRQASASVLNAQVQPITGSIFPVSLNSVPVTVPVSGTFFQSTQPVSLSSIFVPISLASVPVPVSGTFWQTTQPVSLASIPVPVSQSGTWNVGSSSNNALADATANPTTNLLGSMGQIYNGATWDRIRTIGAVSGATLSTGLLATANAAFNGTNYQVITTNSTSTTNKFGLDSNILSILGTAPTTAGQLDVRQSSASVLNAQVQPIVGATFPVSGTFWQATQPISLASVMVPISLASIPVPVSGTFWQTTQPVSLASVPVFSMNAGAVDTGTLRVVQANNTGRTLTSASGSAASNGNNTLVVAGTNKLKVYAFTLSTVSTTAVTCIFQSGAGGTELWRVILQTPASVSGGANLAVSPPAWLFATGSATLLNLNLSAAVAVNWSCSYFDEA